METLRLSLNSATISVNCALEGRQYSTGSTCLGKSLVASPDELLLSIMLWKQRNKIVLAKTTFLPYLVTEKKKKLDEPER